MNMFMIEDHVNVRKWVYRLNNNNDLEIVDEFFNTQTRQWQHLESKFLSEEEIRACMKIISEDDSDE